jgi:hypothetical protein
MKFFPTDTIERTPTNIKNKNLMKAKYPVVLFPGM